MRLLRPLSLRGVADLTCSPRSGSTFLIVMTQVLQGMGGGIAATTTQMFAQAVVPHQGKLSRQGI